MQYKHIESIDLVDTFHNGSRKPGVWIKVHASPKPYKLNQLGVEALELFVILQIAKNKKNF